MCICVCVIGVVPPRFVDANAIIANTLGYLFFVDGCYLAAPDELSRCGLTFVRPEVYILTKNTGQFMLQYFDLAGNNITSAVPRGVSRSCRLFSEIREQTPSSSSSASQVSLGSPMFVRQLLITVNENRATGGRQLIYPFNPLLHHEYGNLHLIIIHCAAIQWASGKHFRLDQILPKTAAAIPVVPHECQTSSMARS